MVTAQIFTTKEQDSITLGMLENYLDRMIILYQNLHNETANQRLRTPRREIRWSKPTIKALCDLPWGVESLPDGRKPPQFDSAAALLSVLTVVLEDETMPPTSIIPTSNGGMAAEWHVNGFDLEIEFDPTTSIEYNVAGPSIEEYEGPPDQDFENLKRHVKLLTRHIDRHPQAG